MPAVSEKQRRAMYAAAEGKSNLGIPQEVGKEFIAADAADPMRAAGVLFVAPDGRVLLVKRGPNGDHPGEWAFPAGHIDPGETAAQAAIRECVEELAYSIAGAMSLVSEKDGFATFRHDCEVFMPQLNDESVGFVWAEPNALPSPIHPGAQSTINEAILGAEGQTRTELDVAKAIMAGDMPSGTKFANMWLFKLRITGTGVAYRSGEKDAEGKVIKEEEFTFRDPALYMNDAFLQRCNGLPTIIEHPKKQMLDSAEFKDRNVGSIFLPYFDWDKNEVWGIAKIYDEAAALAMQVEQLSTSPSVVFRKSDGNTEIQLKSGEPLLIEGNPSLLDHLAICLHGVWDKGGEPAGVVSEVNNGASEMSDEKTRADAEPDKLEKILDGLSGLSKRFDSIETRMDAMEKKGDEYKEAKKDSEEKKEEEKKADAKKDADMPSETLPVADKKDSAKKDEDAEMAKAAEKKLVEAEALKKAADEAKADAAREVSSVKELIADLQARLPKELSDADYAAMADAQAKADEVFSAFGDSAPRPLNGESLVAYQKRLTTKLKGHSKAWKEIDLMKLDDGAFAIAQGQIYADAMSAAMHPTDLPANGLREIFKTDRAGRRMSEFVGSPNAWMADFKLPARLMQGISKEGK